MNNMEKSRGNLLLEFFSEEIPARMQLNSEIQLQNLFSKSLKQRDIAFESFKTFSGPRHLSILIKSIELEQKDQEIEKRGPRFDANQKAIDGFLKSNQLKIDETVIKETNNGKFYFHSQKIKGQKTYEILPDIINEIINGFVWPKSQRWANTDLKWARPLRNIVLLLNDDVVKGKVEIGKNLFLSFTNFTFSHRYSDQKIVINKIENYEQLLEENFVILDRNKRLDKIINDASYLLDKEKLKLVNDKSLLEEVVGLVEYPNILIGSIRKEFMKLPREVLSTAMRVHQKYFSITDKKNYLESKFLFVANSIKEKDRDFRVVEGNERVLKARLSDASYFFENDISNTFENWNEKLKHVLFYESLGSLHDKIIRMANISKIFAKEFGVKSELAKQAAILSKADLVSEMVMEFPELQGIMGGYYAKIKNEHEEVAKAIFEHYKPKGVSDDLPETKLGSLLSMVDKIDTLVGFFSIGKKPTGSKDPFALRRNSLSIVQILINFKLNLSLNELLEPSLKEYGCSSQSIKHNLIDFMIDKLKYVFSNKSNRMDVVNSVLNTIIFNDIPIKIISIRIDNIIKFTKSNDFKIFLANFKRINNILKNEKFSNDVVLKVNTKVFETIEEQNINNLSNTFSKRINEEGICEKSQDIMINYLIKMNEPISLFFDKVKVNHNDYNIRINRLNLLKNLHNSISKFSRFELIQD